MSYKNLIVPKSERNRIKIPTHIAEKRIKFQPEIEEENEDSIDSIDSIDDENISPPLKSNPKKIEDGSNSSWLKMIGFGGLMLGAILLTGKNQNINGKIGDKIRY